MIDFSLQPLKHKLILYGPKVSIINHIVGIVLFDVIPGIHINKDVCQAGYSMGSNVTF